MPTDIKFGTSGWRGLIARDFTFQNVQLAAQGVADYIQAQASSNGTAKPVILGHDTRFLGPEFTQAVAHVFKENGLIPKICDGATPTPVIAFTIRKQKAAGGVNITASHNPAEYQGFKFSMPNGAGAPPEVTKEIETRIKKRQAEDIHFSFNAATAGDSRRIDPRPDYFKQIRKLVDFDAIRHAKLKLAVNLMYGTGRTYLDALVAPVAAHMFLFNQDPNPLFGGHHPEPSAENMAEVSRCVRSGKAQLGLGLDGDADRFGIVDADGTWLTPNQVLALTLYHLKKNRGWTGSVVRTVPTSHQVDAVAALFGVKVHETPVGFKYIGALMESEPVIVGGEESGGLSVKGHVPEKDGILACLLMTELVAVEKQPLGAVLKALEKQTMPFFTDRINIPVSPQSKEALLKKLGAGLEKIGSAPVQKFITTDGYKFLLPDGEWVAFRASGTEPLFRCYLEARSEKGLAKLREAARKLLV